MRRGYTLITMALVLLTGVGCDPLAFRLPTEVLAPAPSAVANLQFATETVARLQTLSVGQPREEVVGRMRAEPVEGCVEWSWDNWEFYLRHNGYLRCIKSELIPSPYRAQTLESEGGRYEMLFYYTGGMSPSGRITLQQLTPVLIGDGRLAGWGWDHPLVRQLSPGLSTAQSAAAPAPSGAPAPPQPPR